MLYQGEAVNRQDPVIKWVANIFAVIVSMALAFLFVMAVLG